MVVLTCLRGSINEYQSNVKTNENAQGRSYWFARECTQLAALCCRTSIRHSLVRERQRYFISPFKSTKPHLSGGLINATFILV